MPRLTREPNLSVLVFLLLLSADVLLLGASACTNIHNVAEYASAPSSTTILDLRYSVIIGWWAGAANENGRTGRLPALIVLFQTHLRLCSHHHNACA